MPVYLSYTDMAGNQATEEHVDLWTAQEQARVLRDRFRRFRGHETEFRVSDADGNVISVCSIVKKGWGMPWVRVAQTKP